MENKIVTGPFVDNIIAKWLYFPVKRYSTNAKDALMLLNTFVQQTPCDLNISFKKQPNTQLFTIDLNGTHAESGYFSMVICLAVINQMVVPLKGWNLKDLKEKYKKANSVIYSDEYDYNEQDEAILEEMYYLEEIEETFSDYFYKFTDEELKALIDYANK